MNDLARGWMLIRDISVKLSQCRRHFLNFSAALLTFSGKCKFFECRDTRPITFMYFAFTGNSRKLASFCIFRMQQLHAAAVLPQSRHTLRNKWGRDGPHAMGTRGPSASLKKIMHPVERIGPIMCQLLLYAAQNCATREHSDCTICGHSYNFKLALIHRDTVTLT